MVAKRADIKTGFICNNNCLFCVQAHKKRFGNRRTEEIFTELKDAKCKGCDSVVFTGGEVTIRNDFLVLVRKARDLGFKTIQIQTNARMFSSPDFCSEAIKAGANEFAPALHGHTPSLHDGLTRAEGSFRQTTQAIRNLKEMGQRVIVNTVVVKPNVMHVPDIARFLVILDVDQFQFAFMHAVGNAMMNFDSMMPKVSQAAPFIIQGLQIGIDSGKRVMAEAMPLCTMVGYERFCSEFHIPNTEIRDVDGYDPCFEETRRTKGKVKFEKCKVCKWDALCEGPWKEYPERRGDSEFQPVT